MAYTLTRADIIQNARDVLNSNEVQIWTPAKLNRAFNRFSRRHAREVGALSVVFTQNLVAGVQQYSTVDGTYEIRRVMACYTENGPPYELPFKRIDELPPWWDTFVSPGEGLYEAFPVYYTARGIGSIFLYQIPSASVTNGLLIDYFFNPGNLSIDGTDDNTPLQFDGIHEDALTFGFCCEMITLNMEDPALVARLEYLKGEYTYYLREAQRSERSPDNDPPSLASESPVTIFQNRGLPANWTVSRGG